MAIRHLAAKTDPAWVMKQTGLFPDDWQREICRASDLRILMLVCRQAGKSSTAAAIGVSRMLGQPDTPVIIVCPTERQSNELLRKAKDYLRNLALPIRMEGEAATKIELTNRSRMIALPGKPTTIRAFGNAALIILDEAAFIDDDVYAAVEPMLAADGQLIQMSTPYGKRGLFYTAWKSDTRFWRKIKITADQVPRKYPPDVLAAKRNDPLITEREFAQEYMCEFVDRVDSAFAAADIENAISDEFSALY
jgi:hypothetical protein